MEPQHFRMKEFPEYRQNALVGIGLQVSAPLGQYDSTKLLNVGTNRWSFRPELGVSKAWDHVTMELISAVTFFTTNDNFYGGKTLQRAPIYSFQGHLIYEFSSVLWAALDTTYHVGGRTTVDAEPGPEWGRARWRDHRAICKPPPFDQACWEHRCLQAHQQRFPNGRHRLAIPVGEGL